MSLRREWGLPLGSHSAQAQPLWWLDCDVLTYFAGSRRSQSHYCQGYSQYSGIHQQSPTSPEREAQTFSLLVTILFSFSAILFYYSLFSALGAWQTISPFIQSFPLSSSSSYPKVTAARQGEGGEDS